MSRHQTIHVEMPVPVNLVKITVDGKEYTLTTWIAEVERRLAEMESRP